MENFSFSLPLEQMSVDVRFDYFNASKNVKPSSFSFHSHTVFEVYFIEHGELQVCIEDETLTLRSHDILIISPHTLHRVKQGSKDFKRFNFRFLLNAEITPSAPYFLYEPSELIKKELFESIEKIYQHIPKIDHGWTFLRAKSYFSILTSHLIEAILPAQKEKDEHYLLGTTQKNKIDQQIQIDRFFSENYSRAVTIEHLAEELHYSKTHTNRLLKLGWGMTFSEKLDRTRLQAAKQYLKDTSEPIHRIAELCGYSTLRGFEIFFQKHTGSLPKAYRKENQ